MRSAGEDGERPTGDALSEMITEPQTPVQDAGLPELGAFTRNEPVTLRRVFGRRSRRVLLLAGDMIIAVVAQLGGHLLAGDMEGLRALLYRGPLSPDGFAAAVAAVSTIVLLGLYRGYRDLHRPYLELARDVITATLWSILITMATLYLYMPARGVSRAAEVIAGGLTAISLSVWRVPFARRAKHTYFQHQVTLVSTNPLGWRTRLPGYVWIRHALTPADFLEAPPATDREVPSKGV